MTGRSAYPFAPPSDLEALIRSVLAPPAEAKSAFNAWRAATDFENLPHTHFRWLAELGRVVDRLDPDWEGVARVKAMRKYCWSNNIHILSTAQPAMAAFAREGIACLALKGAGQMARDAEVVQYRMISDCDLMVATDDVGRASELLLDLGWRPVGGRLPGRIRAQAFDRVQASNSHAPDRIEIDLHHRAVHFGRYGRFDEAMWPRAGSGSLLGTPVMWPSAVDQALIAISQALTPGPGETFVWIADLVRAFRDPAFDGDLFSAEVRRRKIDWHAHCVLGYAADTFGIPRQIVKPAGAIPRARLHRREIAVIGRARSQRSLVDRAALFLAEALRSGFGGPGVRHKTDFGVRMRPASTEVGTPKHRLPDGAAWHGKPNGTAQAEITVVLDDAATGRWDYDLWIADRWRARLKIKRAGKHRLVWRALVDMPDKADVSTIRLSPVPR